MMKLRMLGLLALAPVTAMFAADKPMPFDRAVYTEVFGEVTTVNSTSLEVVPAKVGVRFAAPDIVKSGRKSRAQLTASDGTLVRIGSNAVFSLEKSSRTVRLEQGALLFHSPAGKGGGSINTNSITCSVIGTTVTVAVDPKGETTIQVLEGTATVTRADGSRVSVPPAHKVVARPGATGPITILSIDPNRRNSPELTDDFDSDLPSAGKISAAFAAAYGSQTAPTFVAPPNLAVISPNGEGQVN